ncbi:hypothetical protein NEHOM01_0931 [Nematocida homosporus]|uniref:uncharacterized protein n=1 Tax=Nematocida homosporus TaxID=1912981 RepID=UPI00221FB39D|nr:uncharacterized protein NEHOM01_0931 [Nematocida homosporus]KAI5185605.1 hypothetical protein NEHOM01_0931 [Nematocida homosporus]
MLWHRISRKDRDFMSITAVKDWLVLSRIWSISCLVLGLTLPAISTTSNALGSEKKIVTNSVVAAFLQCFSIHQITTSNGIDHLSQSQLARKAVIHSPSLKGAVNTNPIALEFANNVVLYWRYDPTQPRSRNHLASLTQIQYIACTRAIFTDVMILADDTAALEAFFHTLNIMCCTEDIIVGVCQMSITTLQLAPLLQFGESGYNYLEKHSYCQNLFFFSDEHTPNGNILCIKQLIFRRISKLEVYCDHLEVVDFLGRLRWNSIASVTLHHIQSVRQVNCSFGQAGPFKELSFIVNCESSPLSSLVFTNLYEEASYLTPKTHLTISPIVITKLAKQSSPINSKILLSSISFPRLSRIERPQGIAIPTEHPILFQANTAYIGHAFGWMSVEKKQWLVNEYYPRILANMEIVATVVKINECPSPLVSTAQKDLENLLLYFKPKHDVKSPDAIPVSSGLATSNSLVFSLVDVSVRALGVLDEFATHYFQIFPTRPTPYDLVHIYGSKKSSSTNIDAFQTILGLVGSISAKTLHIQNIRTKYPSQTIAYINILHLLDNAHDVDNCHYEYIILSNVSCDIIMLILAKYIFIAPTEVIILHHPLTDFFFLNALYINNELTKTTTLAHLSITIHPINEDFLKLPSDNYSNSRFLSFLSRIVINKASCHPNLLAQIQQCPYLNTMRLVSDTDCLSLSSDFDGYLSFPKTEPKPYLILFKCDIKYILTQYSSTPQSNFYQKLFTTYPYSIKTLVLDFNQQSFCVEYIDQLITWVVTNFPTISFLYITNIRINMHTYPPVAFHLFSRAMQRYNILVCCYYITDTSIRIPLPKLHL